MPYDGSSQSKTRCATAECHCEYFIKLTIVEVRQVSGEEKERAGSNKNACEHVH